MLQQILTHPDLLFYVLAAELFALIFLHFRTNFFMRKMIKARARKKEQLRLTKEEIKNEESKIPVVKFDKPNRKALETKKVEKTGSMDSKELAVLQEMMTEFFG